MLSTFKPSQDVVEESKDREVQIKLKQIEDKTKSPEAKEKLRQLGRLSDRDISQLVLKAQEHQKQQKR